MILAGVALVAGLAVLGYLKFRKTPAATESPSPEPTTKPPTTPKPATTKPPTTPKPTTTKPPTTPKPTTTKPPTSTPKPTTKPPTSTPKTTTKPPSMPPMTGWSCTTWQPCHTYKTDRERDACCSSKHKQRPGEDCDPGCKDGRFVSKSAAAPAAATQPIAAPSSLPMTPTTAPSTLPGGKQNVWDCATADGKSHGPVNITWGFRPEDATWACNTWRGGCKGACTAVPAKRGGPNQEYWTCTTPEGKAVDTIKLWWGYKPADAAWACNQWSATACAGKCTATPL